MKNSLRISTFIIALVVIIAGVSTSYASTTRMKALGMSDVDSYWMIQKDTVTAFVYNPAFFAQFPALVSVDPVGTNGTPNGTIFLNPIENVYVAFQAGGGYATGSESGFQQIGSTTTTINTSANTIARDSYLAAAAYKMGNMGFGIRYGSSSKSDKNSSAANTSWEKNVQAIGLGFYMDLGGGMNLDAGFKYTMYDFSTSGSALGTNKYKADPADIFVYGRFNLAMSEVTKLHLYANMINADRSDKLGTTKVTATSDSITLGVSDEMNFTQNAFFYFGFAYIMNTSEVKVTGSKTTIDTTSLKFNTGVQASLTKNLIMQMGAYRTWWTDVTTKATGAAKKETSNDSATTGTLGVNYKWGHFSIETWVNTSYVLRGPYFVTGSPQTDNLFLGVTVAYVFNTTANLDDEKK